MEWQKNGAPTKEMVEKWPKVGSKMEFGAFFFHFYPSSPLGRLQRFPKNLFGLFLTSKGYFNFSGYLK